MTPVTSTETIQRLVGYHFQQPHLLEEALTHKSFFQRDGAAKDRGQNERLEFLGDAVLSLVMSDYLANEFPDSRGGGLSKLKAQLVSEASLARAATADEAGSSVRLGKGRNSRRGGKNILCLQMLWRR